MLEPSILGKHNRREPHSRLEFATLLTVPGDGDPMKAKLALGVAPGFALLTHTVPATGTDKSATTLTQAR
jgi:hypothetical protein